MIKRSAFHAKNPNPTFLYDYARNDIFLAAHGYGQQARHLLCNGGTSAGDSNETSAPSITAILLLQMEVSLIQLISSLSAKAPHGVILQYIVFPVQQAIRWVLLFGLIVLDNISHILGVDREMDRLSQRNGGIRQLSKQAVELQVVHLEPAIVEQQDFSQREEAERTEKQPQYYQKEHNDGDQDDGLQPAPTDAINSPCRSPIPTAAYGKQSERSRKISTPTMKIVSRGGHVRSRSLSNNMTLPAKHATHGHTLRRIDGQRNLVSVTSTTPSSSSSSCHDLPVAPPKMRPSTSLQ